MASSIILKRATGSSSGLLTKQFCFPRRCSAVAPSSRAFNTNVMKESSSDDDEQPILVDRRRVSPSSADVYDPFKPTRIYTLGQFLNYLEETQPVNKSGSNVSSVGMVSKADDDASYLKFDMPGVGKEDVKVTFEQDFLLIKAERAKDDGFGESGNSCYNTRIKLEAADRYKIDEIKAEMKNGVLKVVIPKLKEEERKDVFQVKVV